MTGNAVTFVRMIEALIITATLILRGVRPQIDGFHVLVELLRDDSASAFASVLPRRRRHVIAHGAAAEGAEVARRRVGQPVNRPRGIPFVTSGRKAKRTQTAVSAGIASISAPSRIRR